ncbi:winged helix-turn-helix domain-containing protein [Occultella aeris]|uniref:Winged helix-turn-helix domain-containing protein n=1 Tax=Occultella aeris TaxID=2761496 RepID=A0A7M4DL45_9MICO|nr:crosslink repair DNA glycosylase YcaQ family protein [Occultella aeris]VZO37939.1 hypothetical protein HALOF300_02860 [Occultella aeris]
MPRTLTLAQARRIAVTAQGLAGAPAQARPPVVTMAHLQRMIDRVGLLQIDSVNVLARAHLLPVAARLGPYDVGLLERATTGTPARPRRLVEYRAHEAAFVPPRTFQLLRWRMQGPRALRWYDGIAAKDPDTMAAVLDIVAEHGPVTAAQVHDLLGHDRPEKVNWGWNWTAAKHSLEAMLAVGRVASAYRNASFERAYDLPERVLPAEVLAEDVLPQDEAIRALVDISARAHGVATIRGLADYFRLSIAQTSDAVARLVAAGDLEEVAVAGWHRPAYLHPEARRPRATNARALLAPFDPLVFERERTLELFGMHYRIEIYTPAAKRQFGYYVLPFLLGDELVARVDLKADRAAGVLRLRSAFAQPEAPTAVGHELAQELRVMADWLDLPDVAVDADAAGDLIGDVVQALTGVR